MESWVQKKTGVDSRLAGAFSKDTGVPRCGDDWCVNGPPGEGCTTYFLCELCGTRAPDVATKELSAQKLKGLTLKQKRAYNATAFQARVSLGLS